MSKYTDRIKNLEKQIKDNLDFFFYIISSMGLFLTVVC
jgi:hypothetical protein